jgi:hypothetical protein
LQFLPKSAIFEQLEPILKAMDKDKAPRFKTDPRLDELQGKVLFPEKLEKANQLLEKTVVPKTPSAGK